MKILDVITHLQSCFVTYGNVEVTTKADLEPDILLMKHKGELTVYDSILYNNRRNMAVDRWLLLDIPRP